MKPIAVRHEVVGRPGMGRPWRIAHLSDIHLWFGSKKLRSIDGCLERWQPEFIALTGDYADTSMGRGCIRRWLHALGDRWPIGWVAGNHDKWFGGRMVRDLESISRAHCVDEADILVRGINGNRHRVTAWDRCFPAVRGRQQVRSERRIVLCHDPAVFDFEAVQGVDLVLAGHLHGGQFVLGRDSAGRSLPAGWLYQWCFDRWDWDNGSLIVSRGLGDTFPLRFNCPQEIVMIDVW